MIAKADLTLTLKDLRDKNVQKDALARTLEEKRVLYDENKIQTLKLRSDIEQKKSEIRDRKFTDLEKEGCIKDISKKI